jgi:salicylate hydroxylase
MTNLIILFHSWLITTIRLLKMAKLAATPARVRVKMVSPMEDWVDEHGRLVIIGEAAHPLPVQALL